MHFSAERSGMTLDSNLIGLAKAVENVENLLKGKPTHVVAGPKK